MTERIDCAVIGAGVVGLAIARALALAGREVLVLEATETIGSQTSSRNSEVIHAGIYYATGSLKARLCVEGKQRLYDYCASRGVAHKRIGKLIVATGENQLPALDALKAKAAANGVTDLLRLSPDEVRRYEPEVAAAGGLYSPSTGIVDSHGYMLALQGDAEAAGAVFAFRSPLLAGAVEADGIRLEAGGAEPMALSCRTVVNAAGLGAQAIGRAIRELDPATVPPLYLCKGNYFTLAGKTPFRRLVYPMPEGAWLGLHVGLDLAGRARFGPDVEWVERIDYRVDPSRGESFYPEIRRYWPGLPDGALQPAYSGVRPKMRPQGGPVTDFVIQGPAQHGIAGLVNLYGIESPGLTSSLAIAEHVLGLLR
jgi:L-2-hydroxyglutarate oxidase LhgO